MPKNPDEIGALWKKESNDGGKRYMSGKINGEEVVIFQNGFKTAGSNEPDFRVYKSKPKGGGATAPQQRQPSQPAQDDDIPW